MSAAITTAALVAAIGSALVAGIFFAISSFVMKALSRVPAAAATAAALMFVVGLMRHGA